MIGDYPIISIFIILSVVYAIGRLAEEYDEWAKSLAVVAVIVLLGGSLYSALL